MLYLTKKLFREGWEHHEARIPIKNEADVTKRHDMLKNYFKIDSAIKWMGSGRKYLDEAHFILLPIYKLPEELITLEDLI